jgi:hypothetical protein
MVVYAALPTPPAGRGHRGLTTVARRGATPLPGASGPAPSDRGGLRFPIDTKGATGPGAGTRRIHRTVHADGGALMKNAWIYASASLLAIATIAGSCLASRRYELLESKLGGWIMVDQMTGRAWYLKSVPNWPGPKMVMERIDEREPGEGGQQPPTPTIRPPSTTPQPRIIPLAPEAQRPAATPVHPPATVQEP